MYEIQPRFFDGGEPALATSGTAVVFTPTERVLVKRIRLVTTVAYTGSTSTVTVARRNADNTSSTTIGTFPLAAIAVNTTQYVELIEPLTTGTTGADGSTVYSTATKAGHVLVAPGQELTITSSAAGTTGTFKVDVEYETEGLNTKLYGTKLAFTAS
jgi:hypothetical protein